MERADDIHKEHGGLSASVERHVRECFAHERPDSGLYDRVLREIEKPLLSVALAQCRGNQLRTAALLGLNRNTLRKKMRELGLQAEKGRFAVRRHKGEDRS